MGRQAAIAVLWIAGLALGTLRAEDELVRSFANPPDACKPWCYWWWLDGGVTKDGITRDLEAMRRQGIAGALVFDAGEGGPLAPKGPRFMSPEWRELFRFALAEANRVGVELTVNLCSGWNAGGSWVKPEEAAQKLVGSQIAVQGPREVSQVLPQPKTVGNYYRDVAVLGYRLGDDLINAPMKCTASSSYQQYTPELAADGDPTTRWISNGDRPGRGPTAERPEHLTWEYTKPFPAAELYLVPYADCGPRDCELQGSDDGKTFQTLCRFTLQQHETKTVPLRQVAKRFFRLVFTSSYPFQGKESWNVQVSEVALLDSGQRPEDLPRQRCDRRQMVDLTAKVDQKGRLAWSAPAGAWMVLRLGTTLVAGQTKCVSPGSAGLEIDPMSVKAMDSHFAATAEKLIADAGPLAGKILTHTHIDSWEIAEQPTWSPDLPAEFRRRYGYVLLPCLPAVIGKTVDSREVSERFLWDYRRMVADLVAENYYGRLGELSRRHGLGTHPESGGPFVGWHDELANEGRNDIPMGEFWYPAGAHADFSLKQAACAAHTYGKRLCQAEAFTNMGPNWEESPYLLKLCGDRAFCHGLTRNVLCFYVHQPDENAWPGYQWEAAGTHFDRHLTWWPQIHAWLTYLSRCQYLLRQGLFVADVCYYGGQDVPSQVPYRNLMNPAMPSGYDYDVCSTEVLLNRISVRDKRIVLPDGMSYQMLVLPMRETMTPEVLQKIASLVEAGATVLGPKPMRSPSLKGYPQCDPAVKRLADRLWDAGKVISGKTIDSVLREKQLAADFEAPSALNYIHRTSDAGEIYFVCNQSDHAVAAECAFRVAARQPELANPVTGQIREAKAFRQRGGRTVVPLELAARESLFVVFRRPTALAEAEGRNFPVLRPLRHVTGPWSVSFDPKWGGPKSVVFDQLEDWTHRPEDGIKYYSGTAVYRKPLELPEVKQPLWLDLGEVKELAEVRLNGKDLGVVWARPFRVEISSAVRQGQNELEVRVTNLWPNRLIGDARLPPEKRLTKTNVQKFYRPPQAAAEHKLLSSGLFGPVTVQMEKQ